MNIPDNRNPRLTSSINPNLTSSINPRLDQETARKDSEGTLFLKVL